MHARLIYALVLAVALALTGVSARYVDRHTTRSTEVELRYLMARENLERISLGYPHLIADLVWIKSVQFYHQEFVRRVQTGAGATDFKWLIEISDLVTDLNPKFVHAYWYFSLYLGGTERDRVGRYDAEHSDAMRLLRKGFSHNRETYFLSYNLAYSYYQYHQRLEDDGARQVLTAERLAELEPLYVRECLFFADHAAAAVDAEETARIAAVGYRAALAGDLCEASALLERVYDGFTQDVERTRGLYPTVLAFDRCHRSELEDRLAARGGPPHTPMAADELAAFLGTQLPICPWGPYALQIASGRPPPRRFADLAVEHPHPPHPHEYFVDPQGQVLSWFEGERREVGQTRILTSAARGFKERFGFTRVDAATMATEMKAKPPTSPFGRRYVYDPIDQVVLPEVEPRDFERRVVAWYETESSTPRRERLATLVRIHDASVGRALAEGVVEPWRLAHPGARVPRLSTLLAPRALPRSLRPLLARFAEGAEPPGRVRDLLAELPPLDPAAPDAFVATPEGDVITREQALAFRAERLAVLNQRLATWAARRPPLLAEPLAVSDLIADLEIPFPADPLGGDTLISADGTMVVVVERSE